jgi:phosphoribosyl-ATP pyrophosphohydrolase
MSGRMSDQTLGSADALAAVLAQLGATIDARAASGDAATSWTARLLAAGPDLIGGKLREEAGELAEAIQHETDARVASEAADLIFHLLVALRSRSVSLDAVAAALAARQSKSGLAEKAARPSPTG